MMRSRRGGVKILEAPTWNHYQSRIVRLTAEKARLRERKTRDSGAMVGHTDVICYRPTAISNGKSASE